REIGVLRSVGMTRPQLTRMLVLEAILQGALGGAVAIVLGGLVSYLWLSNSLYSVLGWSIEYSLPWQAVGIVFLVGVGVAIAASLYPARQAARIEIREALAYE